MTWTEYLKSRRTLTEHDVTVQAAHHDSEDYSYTERVSYIDSKTLGDLVAVPRKDHTTVLSG